MLTPLNGFARYVKRDVNAFRLFTPDGNPYKIPLARLKDMAVRFLTKDTEVQQWLNTHIDWRNDIIEAKSKRVIACIDDIAQLFADKIHINRKGKLVFMQGWDAYNNTHNAKFDAAAIKAQKWENKVQCEVIGKHLAGKMKNGGSIFVL